MQRREAVPVPSGHCRRCRATVEIANIDMPTITPNGRVVAKGVCPDCETAVTAFVRVLDLTGKTMPNMNPSVAGLIGAALRKGYETAVAEAHKSRADAILSLQRRWRLTHCEMGAIFGLSRQAVAAALGDARRRERENASEEIDYGTN